MPFSVRPSTRVAPTTAPISTPAASFYGRTYLLSTVRVPPFPPISSTGEAGLLGGATPHLDGGRPEAERLKEEEEEVVEERRAFESMRDALQGTAALGTTGFYPRTGSPVVLDLGAVSQVPRSFLGYRSSCYNLLRMIFIWREDLLIHDAFYMSWYFYFRFFL